MLSAQAERFSRKAADFRRKTKKRWIRWSDDTEEGPSPPPLSIPPFPVPEEGPSPPPPEDSPPVVSPPGPPPPMHSSDDLGDLYAESGQT